MSHPTSFKLRLLFSCFSVSIFLSCSLHAQEAKRIVSLVPWMTKSLQILGEESRLVGKTNFCPPTKISVPIVASAVQVNVERCLLTKPDLIFTSSLTKPQITEQFSKLGIRTFYCAYPKSFQQICDVFIAIGDQIGQHDKAVAIVKTQKTRLDHLRTEAKSLKSMRILLQIGAKPLFCATPNTFLDDLISNCNGVNIAKEVSSGNISREFVLQQNPEVILIVTMGVVAEEEKVLWMNYNSLAAAKRKAIFILDADQTCSPTPTLFVDAVEEVIRLLKTSSIK